VGWAVFFLLFFVLSRSAIELTIDQLMGTFGVSYQAGVAGAYSMEVTVTALSIAAVTWRLVWALDGSQTLEDIKQIVQTRSALFATSISFILMLGLTNRLFWWWKHFYTDEAYLHVEWTGAANSVVLSKAMCWLIFAVFSPKRDGLEDHDFISFKASDGFSFGFAAFGAGCLSYVLGVIYYVTLNGGA
jgi:hypothetical protein